VANSTGIDVLPDEGLARGRVVPAAIDGLLHVVGRDHEIFLVPGADLLDDAPVGDDQCLVVADALRGPDGAGLTARWRPAGTDSEDLHHPGFVRVADDQVFAAVAARGQEAIGLHQRTDQPHGVARLPAALQGEDLGLLDGHDLPAGFAGHRQFAALVDGAFGDGQLVLIHMRVRRVDVGVGFRGLRYLAQDLAVIAQRPAGVLDAPVHVGHGARPVACGGHDVDARVGAGVGMGKDQRTVGGGFLAHGDHGAAFVIGCGQGEGSREQHGSDQQGKYAFFHGHILGQRRQPRKVSVSGKGYRSPAAVSRSRVPPAPRSFPPG
jgi:hypothetical protein